ncbi:MAG: hypothetical protein JW969_17320 [Spirochaetales bacterium]|nr:hypothetical protein [Spirochaetales bacterium]
MKAFLICLSVFLGLMIGLSVLYHVQLTLNPRKIVVAVDTSVRMKNALPDIRAFIADLRQRRYAEFCLITGTNRIHDFSQALNLGPLNDSISYFGARELERMTDIKRFPSLAAADEIYFLTNAADITPLEKMGKGKIVQFTPLLD